MLRQDSKLTCVNLQLNLCLNFGVEFSYLHSFFYNDIFNHALVIYHLQEMLLHCII